MTWHYHGRAIAEWDPAAVAEARQRWYEKDDIIPSSANLQMYWLWAINTGSERKLTGFCRRIRSGIPGRLPDIVQCFGMYADCVKSELSSRNAYPFCLYFLGGRINWGYCAAGTDTERGAGFFGMLVFLMGIGGRDIHFNRGNTVFAVAAGNERQPEQV